MRKGAPDPMQLDPRLLEMYMGALYQQTQGNRSGALLAYRRLQSRFPGFADGWTDGSVVLSELGRHDEALGMAERGLALAPGSPAAHCAAGNALRGLGRAEEAAGHYGEAILLDPAHSPSLTNLAGIHLGRGDFKGALELGGRAIEADPKCSVSWANRGYARMRALDLGGAEADLRRALELDTGNHQARWNLAYLHLLQGRHREAWPNFRARMELDAWSGNRRAFGKPHWKGEALDGRALLVYTEQGLGDTLQFSRFLPRLKEYGGRVLLLARPPLVRLLSRLPGVDAPDGLLAEGGPLPDFDFAVSIMDLPAILDAGPDDLAPLPPPALPPCWTMPPMHELDRPGFKVGLAWAGSPIYSNDANRSMGPRPLDGLADIPGADGADGVSWYGLQKPPSPDPPALPGFADLSKYMGDFMDTAQIARRLDLVVTVDTSVAHLAGLLGVPAIVLLPYMPDWRWGLGEKTPWYPEMVLLRQPGHGDWGSVVGALKMEIASRADSFRPSR
jgi:Flp pilus assembly protein TadD